MKIKILCDLVVEYDDSLEEGPHYEKLRRRVRSKVIDYPNSLRRGDNLSISRDCGMEESLLVKEVRHDLRKGFAEVRVEVHRCDKCGNKEEAERELEKLKQEYSFVAGL